MKKNKQNNNIVTEINEAIFLLSFFYFYLSTLHLFSVKGLTQTSNNVHCELQQTHSEQKKPVPGKVSRTPLPLQDGHIQWRASYERKNKWRWKNWIFWWYFLVREETKWHKPGGAAGHPLVCLKRDCTPERTKNKKQNLNVMQGLHLNMLK